MSEPLSEDMLLRSMREARKASSADQVLSDTDQTAADTDQVLSDTDQTAAEQDQTGADRDQAASDLDQATADKHRAGHRDSSPADEQAYAKSREDREEASYERLGNRFSREMTARDRDAAAADRDRVAEIRDAVGGGRDAHAGDLSLPLGEREAQLLRDLADLRAEAAGDRMRAAEDRARAAADRAKAAAERTRLEGELAAAQRDELTGAYLRDMGRLAISHEIERARRSRAPFVVASVDVDGLKAVNDRGGHAAGDRALVSVVGAMRARLRTFDPIIRSGGAEFVCGLAGTDLAEGSRRFDQIGKSIKRDAGVEISVGLAELAPGDTADGLTERANLAMLRVKAARVVWPADGLSNDGPS